MVPTLNLLAEYFLSTKVPRFFDEKNKNIASIIEYNGLQIIPFRSTIVPVALGSFLHTVYCNGTHISRHIHHRRVL